MRILFICFEKRRKWKCIVGFKDQNTEIKPFWFYRLEVSLVFVVLIIKSSQEKVSIPILLPINQNIPMRIVCIIHFSPNEFGHCIITNRILFLSFTNCRSDELQLSLIKVCWSLVSSLIWCSPHIFYFEWSSIEGKKEKK